MMAISTNMNSLNDVHFSVPMVKDHSSSGSSSSHQNRLSSPEQSSASKSSKSSPLAPEVSRVEKRKANTMAARRYRQKRLDQVSTLESELKDVKTERDDLKVRCARLEGEVETLRALLTAQK
jgi:predicted RNase H-like nuclease (RuvC/YqgF family)